MVISTGKPYKDKKNKYIYRFFNVNIDSMSLVWHRDKRDRCVKVIYGSDWYLQIDNQMPIKLLKNQTYIIPKEIFHRIIKGKSNLLIRIKEFNIWQRKNLTKSFFK